ncbi:MAG: hypothetical protein EPO51_00615 [Phenylobacterium sp.]|uniref:hypothetical protein n=1 Tax=Phenylobacterium sp. TaxID=1871053 RepID=UPI0011FCA0AA|nr:hypothetical protein [Phenylobacterium sp.]TAJ74592.1 MAG: hypothetical protein EPO51_00615 [Phenylobacterium sp.]
MIASLLVLVALAGQPATSDDGPVETAPKERTVDQDALPGLDEKTVEIPPAAKPTDEKKTAPAAAAARSLTVEQKTIVQGETLQVVLGQRALFHLDAKGRPVLDKVEEGQLAAAHPPGVVTETFEPPPAGQIAAALDGSAEARATILKVWNETEQALDYGAIALIMRRGKVTPEPAPICAVAPKSVRTETWPRPVVAVGLLRFKSSATTKACK